MAEILKLLTRNLGKANSTNVDAYMASGDDPLHDGTPPDDARAGPGRGEG